jgi:hypothetical protein
MQAFIDIFHAIDNASSEEEKVHILRQNKSPAMIDILRWAYHPNGEFYTTTVPTYIPDESPDGLSMSNLYSESKRMYILAKDYPVDAKRKEEILIQILESLGSEAPIMEQIVQRKFKSLTKETVSAAFPGLFEVVEQKV